jgi:hypothetical protein
MVKRLLELIRRNQVFFEKNFPEPARHPRNPVLSGMTYTFVAIATPFVTSRQVAESHVLVGIVWNSRQVVKAIPLNPCP